MPTFRWLPRFGADFDGLTPTQQAAFLAAVALFVDDLGTGRGFRAGLRVKGVNGAPRVYEMTWANDGRATFHYGSTVREGEPHIVWRRVRDRERSRGGGGRPRRSLSAGQLESRFARQP